MSFKITALYLKRAKLIGRAKVRDSMQRVSSANLALNKVRGQKFADSSKKFPMAGRNKTGNGRMKRDNAD